MATGIADLSRQIFFTLALVIAATGIPVLALVKILSRAFAVVVSTTSTIVKKTTKILASTATGIPIVLKRTSKTLASTAIGVALLAASYQTTRVFNIVVTGLVTFGTIKTIFVAGAGLVRRALARIYKRRRL